MVAGVYQDASVGAGVLGEDVAHAPVGDIGVIKRGLEGFVFDKHLHAARHGIVPLAKGAVHALLAGNDVVLAGIVGAIGEPEADRIALDGLGDGDAVHEMAMG